MTGETQTTNQAQKISENFDISLKTAETALHNLETDKSKFIAVSGKIGSGKDTIAPLVMKAFGVDEDESVQEYFARPLKEEVQQVIEIFREYHNVDDAVFAVAKRMGISYNKSLKVYGFMSDEIIKDRSLTSYSRTPGIRKALQYWGTEVRREQDTDYWVKKALKSVYEKIADGKSVYITDNRFPNEVLASSLALAKTIRLDVSPEEQERRIMNRDSILISEDARNHASETSLDDYKDYDVRILTDYLTPDEIVEKIMEEIS